MKDLFIVIAAIFAFFILVVAMPIYTFGHSFNHQTECNKDKFDVAGCKTMTAFATAIFWPLYWSVELQKPEESHE